MNSEDKLSKPYASSLTINREWSKVSKALDKSINGGADPEILESGGALCRPQWLAGEENFRFHMV